MSVRAKALIGSEMREQNLTTLAAEITRAGSRQTYYIIRWLVDGDLVDAAMAAYAYFRWLDDAIDDSSHPRQEILELVARQKSLMAQFRAGQTPENLRPEERLLAALIARERREHPGLNGYLENMMAVMAFDAGRRGRLISRRELSDYTETLSRAVMYGLTYFIGNTYPYPVSPSRDLAVAGAHICHMLRDTVEDVQAGYNNIPREVLESARISPSDLDSPAYRDWVANRVSMARRYLREGKRYILRLRNARAVLAGLAYCARFERVLDVIERDRYRLRAHYRRGRTGRSTPESGTASPQSISPTRLPLTDIS